MKKLLIAAAFAVVAATNAHAADMAARTYTKAPAYAAPVYNWTGIYIGAHVGGAFGDNGFSNDPAFINGPFPFIEGNRGEGRFFGGGQLGADYQFSPNWLIGIEGQFSELASPNRTITSTGTFVLSERNEWLASVTGRIGYVWGPGVIYAKGGVAFRDDGSISGVITNVPVLAAQLPFSRDTTGYTVGGGVEYMFAPAWSAKLEYQYYNFGATSVSIVGGGPPPNPVTRIGGYRDDIHTVKAGINYRFNWGGPVVASY